MEEWTEIRRRVLVEGVSRRQILRETGMHWRTLKKILKHSEPPGYQQKQTRPRKKLGPFEGRIDQILKEDQAMPRKQRHTAKRLWQRLQTEGFTGGYTIVKDVVRQKTQRQQEVFVPLVHAPGEAQVDFGEALVKMNGTLRKVAFFVMALPYSDAPRHSGRGMCRGSSSSGVCRGGSATTTPRWPWRRSSGEARAGA